ncbi:MAG: 3-methyl-2-oxobutanoate dehydrogenase subunit VorB [Mogibacterium sp.]|mgnify:CR=1 FL=1|nr:3-methyl-2-oxobutanoate dehydrogenase subunit VorB [Mogibacterium sp.]
MAENRIFMKGCEAIAEAATRAGCRFFAGYPITPQNEIPEYMARRLPEVGGTFVQGESEVASVNMLYGSAATGVRAMSSSSSTGISLYSEGVSYMAAARLPAVYVNVVRGGPGIGAIQPSQQDYFQATKASGNGGFQMLVLAPATVQECVDMTYSAFDLAAKYRNPVLVLTDGVMGTMMEPVVLPPMKSDEEVEALKAAYADAAITGHAPVAKLEDAAHCMAGSCGGSFEPNNIAAAAMYKQWEKDEVEYEEYMMDDAEIVVASYGISARISKAVINVLRAEGMKIGMIRPMKVNPFPYEAFANLDYSKVKGILDVEMSIPAQMKFDVEHAVQGRCPIAEVGRSGGIILTNAEVEEAARKLAKEVL